MENMMGCSLSRLSVQKGRANCLLSMWGGMQSPCGRAGGAGGRRGGQGKEEGKDVGQLHARLCLGGLDWSRWKSREQWRCWP